MDLIPLHELADPCLTRDPADVAIGASLGNLACFARTTLCAGIDGFWDARLGQWFLGSAQLIFNVGDQKLTLSKCIYEPAAMAAVHCLGQLEVLQRCFIPPGDASRIYIWARVRNHDCQTVSLRITAQGILQAGPSAMHRRQPDPSDMERRFVSEQAAPLKMNWQAFGVLRAKAEDGSRLQLTCSSSEAPTLTADNAWQHETEMVLKPADTCQYWLCFEILHDEPSSLPPTDAPTAYASLMQHVAELEACNRLGTPSAWLNDGMLRSRLNTYRVMHHFRMGSGFNNDPPGSLLVTRDAAWFSMGANYFAPDFCRRMLDTISRHAPYPDGKIAEYLDLNSDPVFKEDYGQNIADPTPLYILAVHHHAALTGDFDWLRQTYPVLRGAIRYLLTQVRDGLVINTSSRTEPCLGQCGWRNVIDGINISGAVTELQALALAAVHAGSAIASELCDEQILADCQAALPSMQAALDEQLWDTSLNRYYLARPVEPIPGPDPTQADTVDQIFPVLFGLASPHQRAHTIQRLLAPPYRAAHGIRSAPQGHATYHPADKWGLCGGVWPNAGAWVAAASAPTHPEEALALMEDIVRPLHAARPIEQGALVPGQFPEWLDGEYPVSKGMALSPWMPPTYTWLVLEGLLGLKPRLEGLEVEPHLPPHWDCVFVRDLRYRDESLSLLITAQAIFSTQPLQACDRTVHLADDVTSEWSADSGIIVMQAREDHRLVACNHGANPHPVTLPEPLGVLLPGAWCAAGAVQCI